MSLGRISISGPSFLLMAVSFSGLLNYLCEEEPPSFTVNCLRASWLEHRTHETAFKSFIQIRQSRDLRECLKPSDHHPLQNGVGLLFGGEDLSGVIHQKRSDLSFNTFSGSGAGVRISRASKYLSTG